LNSWNRYTPEGTFAAMGGSDSFPQVQGWDFAGETCDGRRVLAFVLQPWMGVGAFAEQIAVPSALLAPLPEALGFPEASTLPACGLTARLLVQTAAVNQGDVVLVTGAAGIVGGFAVQLARGRGARVVAAVRDRDASEARRLGPGWSWTRGPNFRPRFAGSGRTGSARASIRQDSGLPPWIACVMAARL
jgi:NADPH:quinone reductase-like Zn-dependent oxidoreductase